MTDLQRWRQLARDRQRHRRALQRAGAVWLRLLVDPGPVGDLLRDLRLIDMTTEDDPKLLAAGLAKLLRLLIDERDMRDGTFDEDVLVSSTACPLAGDLMMVSVLLRLKSSGILDEYPNLAAYVARGEARAAYKRAFEAQLAVYTGKPPTGCLRSVLGSKSSSGFFVQFMGPDPRSLPICDVLTFSAFAIRSIVHSRARAQIST